MNRKIAFIAVTVGIGAAASSLSISANSDNREIKGSVRVEWASSQSVSSSSTGTVHLISGLYPGPLGEIVKKDQVMVEIDVKESSRKTEVRAPRDGIISKFNCKEGDQVKTGQILFDVSAPDLQLNATVEDKDSAELSQGMKATVVLYSFPDKKFTALVASILPVRDANPHQRSLILNFNPDSTPPNYMAGMTGNLSIGLAKP